ncbi:unnamed protein product, partial [Mesorhabditis belari]|uniref:Uncharacterized protein n=1 Tax=Mesorhabditis belari TaxID=2138241 RepID=A0AAF3FML5_9BILA
MRGRVSRPLSVRSGANAGRGGNYRTIYKPWISNVNQNLFCTLARRRRDQLFDVVSVAALQQQIDQGNALSLSTFPRRRSIVSTRCASPDRHSDKIQELETNQRAMRREREKIQSKAAKEWLERGAK